MLLVDVTASMTKTQLAFDARYAQVVNAFLQGLTPNDRAGVGLIADTTRFTEMTVDQRALAASVRALFRVPDSARLGPSPLWDSLDETLDRVADGNRKPAIIVFSDGKAGGNRKGLDEVIDRAKTLGVAVSSVVEGPGVALMARSPIVLDPADAFERFAQTTGGLRLLDRPMNPRERNPGPMIALLVDGLRRTP